MISFKISSILLFNPFKLYLLLSCNMKVNFRSRRIVLQSQAKDLPKNSQSVNKVLPNKVILRKQFKEQQQAQKPALKSDIKQVRQPKQIDETSGRQSSSDIITDSNFIEYNQPSQFLQARDRRTLVRYEFKQRSFQLQNERERLNQWLGQMHFKVVSSSFNLFITNELTFQEVKVHCCENLLLNILNFLQQLTQGSGNGNRSVLKKSLSYLELSEILKHINQTLYKNLNYMQIKYPLTKDTKPNKSLQALIFKINNLGNDEHDLIMKSGIQFKLKKQDNYTPEIMKFLNFMILKQSELCKKKSTNNKKELTYYEYFYETMQKIFSIIYKPEYEITQKKVIEVQQKKEQDPAAIFAKILLQKDGEDIQEDSAKNKEEKQYKEKVMKYTHYLIGQKFTSNVETYTEQQIQTQIFDVKHSSILRVLTKWTEQLESKILEAEQQILKRPFRFKRNKEYQFSKLSANQKNDLFQQTKRRAKQVNAFNEQLQQNYNEIEAMLSSHLKQESTMNHIPKNQYKVGYFCAKIQAAASSTLMSYLNKIIHILLQIPNELKKNHADDSLYLQNMDINLITFKISDLFRCKIKSRQAEIIRIFKHIKQISEKGEPFKIVRIKDRLNLGTKDILINVIFMNIFLCEIQLAIQEYMETKQMSYDTFSHFLYEMKRSRLGPIMESACTWAQFDQRSKIFRPLNHQNKNIVKSVIAHACGKNYFVNNNYPFVCSLCQKFYSTQQGLVQHRKCNLCKTYYECSLCIFNKMTPQLVAHLIGLNDKLDVFVEDFKLWKFSENMPNEFPKFGLLTSKKMKKANIIFFQTVIFKYDAYIIKTLDTAEIQIIEKVTNNSTKIWKLISESYIIYQWKQKRAINITITPNVIKQLNEEEKKNREQAIKAKKDQKERKKAQLQAKRKEEEERRKNYFEKDKDQKEDKKAKKDGQADDQQDGDQSQSGQKRKGKRPVTTQNANKPIITRYHQKIAKKNESFKFRIISKKSDGFEDILVLGTFLSESAIRNKLKQITNKNILQKLITQKIEVLFLQQEYIHNQLNDYSRLTDAEKNQLKETLQRVSEIYFDNNFIDSIDILQAMTNLKVAHLSRHVISHNKITDLSYLVDLKHLSELILQNNQINSLCHLINKPDLVELNLNRNQIPTLVEFQNIQDGDFIKLRNFYINNNYISSMQGLERLPSLVKLDLAYNQIQQIHAITTLVHIQEIDLSYNNLSSLAGIQNYSSLKKLFLNNNKIKVMSKNLSSLQNLEVLQMASNNISKIKNINQGQITKSLKHLNLSSNFIQKIQGLDGLQNLNVLNLSNNQIQSIGNNYLDFSNLVKWDLSNNCIEQLTIDDAEQYLPCLKELKLNSNPLNDSQVNRLAIKSLQKLIGNIKIQLKKPILQLQLSEQPYKETMKQENSSRRRR